jgi:hypothetical protein
MPVSQSPQSATECQNLSEFFNAIDRKADIHRKKAERQERAVPDWRAWSV